MIPTPVSAILRTMSDRIVDWMQVDTVLLDMDGTLLDLHFDNRFWNEHLPRCYAQARGLDEAAARAELMPVFAQHAGQLNWYCTDFWSRTTALDIMALKQDLRDLIQPLPGTLTFLDAVAAAGRPAWIVTNAHPDVVAMKMACTGLAPRFAGIVTSHDIGYAKEHPDFWAGLAERIDFQPERALFVDDSPAVVAAAQAYGIGQVVAIARPDTRGAVREHAHHRVVDSVADIRPD